MPAGATQAAIAARDDEARRLDDVHGRRLRIRHRWYDDVSMHRWTERPHELGRTLGQVAPDPADAGEREHGRHGESHACEGKSHDRGHASPGLLERTLWLAL